MGYQFKMLQDKMLQAWRILNCKRDRSISIVLIALSTAAAPT
jgi:hypothetical protein